MSDLVDRLHGLEALLALPDPRPSISAYHNMPYALFRYDPEDEFELRREISMLQTRLEQGGKRVSRVSLAQCLEAAMTSVQPLDEWYDAERRHGTPLLVETIHSVLAEEAPLVDPFVWGFPAHCPVCWNELEKLEQIEDGSVSSESLTKIDNREFYAVKLVVRRCAAAPHNNRSHRDQLIRYFACLTF